jgi:hypothetical protein
MSSSWGGEALLDEFFLLVASLSVLLRGSVAGLGLAAGADPSQILTTPREKKEDKDIDDLEAATWYKQAFDLRGLGAAMKPAMNKAPKELFDLDAEQSIKTIHNRHLKPTFTLEDDDDDSEGYGRCHISNRLPQSTVVRLFWLIFDKTKRAGCQH